MIDLKQQRGGVCPQQDNATSLYVDRKLKPDKPDKLRNDTAVHKVATDHPKVWSD